MPRCAPAMRPEGLGEVTPELITARMIEEHGRVRAVFTTRIGGTSRGPYAGFNLAPSVGDAPDAVAANRRLLAAALDIPPYRIVEAEQVHGCDVAIVGSDRDGASMPRVDALTTVDPGVWLVIYTADCVPALIYDTRTSAVAAVHAGWRGVAGDILASTLRAMRLAFGTTPSDCRIVLGPAIGGCCYEVDLPVARAMESSASWSYAARPTAPGRWHLDLRQALRRQAVDQGISPRDVEEIPGCTRCESKRFFSYRRERVTGRMAACICLRERAGRE
jgi:polyphenol oxidase